MSQIENIAIIDLGSNTFHLIIGRFEEGRLILMVRKQIPTQLGQGMFKDHIIQEDAIQRGVSGITIFKEEIDKVGVNKIIVKGTAALREAKNGREVIEKFENVIGSSIEIISGQREAELIYKGVLASKVLTEEITLTLDIGGGSNEFIIGNRNGAIWMKSFLIGGNVLMDKFVKQIPMMEEDVENLENFLADQLKPLLDEIKKYEIKTLIGVAGAFETFKDLEMKEKNAKLNSMVDKDYYPLDFKTLMHSFETLINASEQALYNNDFIVDFRKRLIASTCIMLRFVIHHCGIKEIKVSNFTLKEGALWEEMYS